LIVNVQNNAHAIDLCRRIDRCTRVEALSLEKGSTRDRARSGSIDSNVFRGARAPI
jgi:hypothetical protein